MPHLKDLHHHLCRLEGAPYPAYKEVRGPYTAGHYSLSVDHVQGDPFADPSRVSVTMSLAATGIPGGLLATPSRRMGVCSHLARRFGMEASRHSRSIGTGKGGLIAIDAPGQEVLPTTAAQILGDRLEVRFQVGLPARGRRAMGHAAACLLCDSVPEIVGKVLFCCEGDAPALRRAAETNEDADALREQLERRGLVAFVADGAVLPRRSGIDARPMTGSAVPFSGPESLRVSVELPNAGAVTGMGIPRGVTLIVGGGFHGKSTLLRALELGVYNHCPGDGRELAVTDPTAVKIRAEDGRSVSGVNISPFIRDLPGGIETTGFSTQDASGSTSQAANILEALEAGCRVLLIDEDTSATNFMIRDQRMQELIAKDKEPITPFVDRVRQLWDEKGISTVLVMGGSGDYFDAADTVIAMEAYRPRDVTAEAAAIARRHSNERKVEAEGRFGSVTARRPDGRSWDPRRGRKSENVKSQGVKTLLFGTEEIDLSAVEQIVHPGQLRAIGRALLLLRETADGESALAQLLDDLEARLAEEGLDALHPWKVGHLAAFRRCEVAAALNRIRTLQVATDSPWP